MKSSPPFSDYNLQKLRDYNCRLARFGKKPNSALFATGGVCLQKPCFQSAVLKFTYVPVVQQEERALRQDSFADAVETVRKSGKNGREHFYKERWSEKCQFYSHFFLKSSLAGDARLFLSHTENRSAWCAKFWGKLSWWYFIVGKQYNVWITFEKWTALFFGKIIETTLSNLTFKLILLMSPLKPRS